MNFHRNFLNIIEKTHALHINCTRNYAFKSDLKIKWVRPEKVPAFKPERSGDLEAKPLIDASNLYSSKFANSKELETADKYVKRLFSLEFSSEADLQKHYQNTLLDRVRRTTYDVTTTEARLAKWTSTIRAWQDTMDKYPRNKKMKVRLTELIDKRHKHLRHLRRWDYKKFEWLIEKLNIVFKPLPTEGKTVTRKDSLRKLTNKYCDNVRDSKLNEYKSKLEAQQPAFLREKIKMLQFIRDEQIACKAEVTVSEEDINAVKEQLKIIEEKKALENLDD